MRPNIVQNTILRLLKKNFIDMTFPNTNLAQKAASLTSRLKAHPLINSNCKSTFEFFGTMSRTISCHESLSREK